jgi:hypothetical protein
LFQTQKEFLSGRHFKSNEEVKDAVKKRLNGLAADVHAEGMPTLVTHYDKSLKVGGNYVFKTMY